jgi:2-pyrone-4,6-dicarboxylate lactonase
LIEAAWDTHVHVVGDPAVCPMVEKRHYTPTAASARQLVAMLDRWGLQYAVVVQPSFYGSDNTLLAVTLAQYPDRLRGIATTNRRTADTEMARLHGAGVRGARIMGVFGGGTGPEELESVAGRCGEIGWHLQLTLGPDFYCMMENRLLALRVPIVIDHFGFCRASEGADGPAFRTILRILREADCWVKLSAAYRLTDDGNTPFHTALPLFEALARARPDRLIWGSDWPHTGLTDPSKTPRVQDLIALFQAGVADPAFQTRILRDNSARLYGKPTA